MTVPESSLTCPHGCTNQGKDYRDWPCSILPEPVQFRLDPKRFESDRELARTFGEGALVRYPYLCQEHGVFGVYRLRIAEPEVEEPRREWMQ